MLGREVNQPAELMFRTPGTGDYEDQTKDQYVADLAQALLESHELAREHLKTAQRMAKRYFDLKLNTRELKAGDLVYQLDTATIKGKCKKLSPCWKGPGVIVKKLTPYLFKVKMKKTLTTANHDRLKLCADRQVPKWSQKLQVRIKQGHSWSGGTDDTGGGQDDSHSDPREIEDPITPTPDPNDNQELYCTCR